MSLEIKKLKKEDFNKVINYAIIGMNLNRYVENNFLLNIYGKYFWYSELINATQIVALYDGDVLAGVLLAEIEGEEKIYRSTSKIIFVKIIDFIEKHFLKESEGLYDKVNRRMLNRYKKRIKPNGEIRFLAANPKYKSKGIGTMLINELARREKGKEIYLFTDNLCTYQFYEHRGFERFAEEDVVLEYDKMLPLRCFLYRKVM